MAERLAAEARQAIAVLHYLERKLGAFLQKLIGSSSDSSRLFTWQLCSLR